MAARQQSSFSKKKRLRDRMAHGTVWERLAALGYLLLLLLGGLLILLILAALYFIFIFDWNKASGLLSSKASAAAGREIVVKGLDIDWGWPTTKVKLEGFSVANVEGAKEPQMVDLEALDATIDIRQFVYHFGRIDLPELVLTKPKVVLLKDKDGKANWDFTSNPAGATATAAAPDERTEMPIIGRLVINDGNLIYRDAKEKTDVNLKTSTATGTSDDKKDQITLDGTGSYQGQALKIKFAGGSIMTLKEGDDPYPVDVNLVAGDTTITAKGTVDDPIQLAGLNLAMTVKGDNAADLFPLTGIALPTTPPYNIKGKLELETADGKPKVWKFNNFAGRLGDSDLGGSLSFDVSRKRPLFKAKFVSSLLDFDDLGGLIGARPDADETASVEQKREVAAKEASPYVLPDVPLDISRLAAMDADVDFTGKQIKSGGLPLDDIYFHITLDNLLLKADPVRFGTANGNVNVSVTINARKEPVQVATDFRFRKLDIERLMAGLSDTLGQNNVNRGLIGGRAKLDGAGKSLKEVLGTSNGEMGIGMEGGRISNLVVELAGIDIGEALGFFVSGDKSTPVRCIVANFDVKDGLATANTFVIDTKDTNIHGKGTLNFKNEAMDITLRPQPKDISLGSLRAPVTIGGTLKSPSIDATGPLARAGAVGALAAIFPPAAVIGLIETGLGEDSNCAGLLGEMKGDTGQKGAKDLVPTNKPVSATDAED